MKSFDFDTEGDDSISTDEQLLGADAITDEEPIVSTSRYRGTAGDPIFGFLIALAISIGLTPMLPNQPDLRYTLAWGALAVVGVISWLLGHANRIGEETVENVIWGISFGILIGVPFLLFAGIDAHSILARAARLIFPNLQTGTVLAYLVFVMPLAETLFFRGLMQQYLDFWVVGLLAGLWNIILFFPVMWGALLDAPAVALFLGVALLSMSMLYSYVRLRNSLAASWITQIIANLIILFLPFL